MRRGLVVCILSSAATALVRPTSLWRAPSLGGAPDGEAEVETVWGASYIGGDPCSSGYNDDPFDERASTLDDFDAFKARVAAIAARRERGEAADAVEAVASAERPSRECAVCGKAFSTRRDSVTTCSKRCAAERRGAKRARSTAGGRASGGGARESAARDGEDAERAAKLERRLAKEARRARRAAS